MSEDEIRDDYLQEIEVIRERKTQFLDRKFALEILKTWMRAKTKEWGEESKEGEQKDEELPF